MILFTDWDKTHLVRCSSVCILFFLVSCANTSAINVLEKVKIKGVFSGLSSIKLPPEALVHLLITQTTSSITNDKVIAAKTIPIASLISNTSYSVEVPQKSILPGQNYTIQACVTIKDKVHMLSHKKLNSLLKVDNKDIDISLTSLQALPSNYDLRTWIAEDEAVLHNSIQSNLSGVCQNSSIDYDKIINKKASEVLPMELLSGPSYQVEELVSLRGSQYLFKITSEFGEFSAQGLPMLRRTIKEIRAMELMKNIEASEEFSKALSDEALDPFGELKALIQNPVDRLYGAVKGVGKFINSSTASLTQKRSNYEDRYLEALLSVSKYKRQFSQQLKIDVYTSNTEVQKRLNRIGWAAALGSWTPSVLLMPISGPKKLVYSSLSFQETLNQLIAEESPDSLRFINKKHLQSAGVSDEEIKLFLSHKFYTPRHHTVIVEAFKSMGDIVGVEGFIQQAISVKNDPSALIFQQLAELLAAYHQKQEAISQIKIYKGIPFGITQTGHWIMLLPIDIGRWSTFAEVTFTGFNELQSKKINTQKFIWISGRATSLFHKNIQKMGITLVENSQHRLPLLD